MIEVSIIIVNFNGKKFVDDCLSSIRNLDCVGISIKVLVIDNGSNDDSIEYIKLNYPEVLLLINDQNNYTRALNLGIQNSLGEYIVFLNNDAKVEKNWLQELLKVISVNPKIGAVQSKILFWDKKTINSVGAEEIQHFYFKDIGFNEKDQGQFEQISKRDYLSGGSVLYRRTCLIDVGPFDEDFIMYFEDMDYSLRARLKGWELYYSPKSIIYHHFHGSSSDQLCDYLCTRNRFLFLAKHYPLKLEKSIRTSHFYNRREGDKLYESLLQTAKKLFAYQSLKTTKTVLNKIKNILLSTLGTEKTKSFFSQLEIALDTRKLKLGIYDHAFHFAGGGQKYMAKILEKLQHEFDVTIITSKLVDHKNYLDWFNIDLSKCEFRLIPIKYFENLGTPYIDEGHLEGLEENCFLPISEESKQFDIFINSSMVSRLPVQSALSIFMCHFPDQIKGRYFSVHQYDYIVANSLYTQSWIKKRWNLNSSILIYPPTENFNLDQNVLYKKKKIILSVARFEIGGSKKQIELIETFDQLCRLDEDFYANWQLVLVGGSLEENPYLDRVIELVEKLKRSNILIKPNQSVSQLKDWYQSASVFWHACGVGEIQPHKIEHFGMSIVEAMQCYCVPIVFDGGGQQEIVEHQISGMRFQNLQFLKQFTDELIKNPNRLKNLAISANEQAQKFSEEIFMNNWQNFLANVICRLKGGESIERWSSKF